VTFGSPATLQAGNLYHLVFTNVDPDPSVNFSSPNALAQWATPSPLQPTVSTTDWALLLTDNSNDWAPRPNFTPILQLNFVDGVKTGIGYRYLYVRNIVTISGSSAARERFVVTGHDRIATGVSIRLSHQSGSDPLGIRLENEDGSLVEQGTIPASSFNFPTVTSLDFNVPWTYGWVTLTFSAPHTLSNGKGYNVVLSAPSTSAYAIFPMGKGTGYGFSDSTFFGDGWAQANSGAGWTDWPEGSSTTSDADLQFYFTTL
jgi:hypothetical protein